MGLSVHKKANRTRQKKKRGLVNEIDPKCVNALNTLIDRLEQNYNVQLVISSTWRALMPNTVNTLKQSGLNYNKQISSTEWTKHQIRGIEISDFLKDKSNNHNFVIIDDEVSDILPYFPAEKMIKTSMIKGSLSLKHVSEFLHNYEQNKSK